MRSCEKASGALGELATDGFGMANRVAIYRAADVVEAVCADASGKVRSTGLPNDVDDAIEELAEKAREHCRSALSWRSILAKRTGEIADEGMSPGRIADVQDAGETVSGDTLLCAGALVDLEGSVAK